MNFKEKYSNGITIKESEKVLQWKLIHKEKRIIMLSYNDGITGTIHSVYSTDNFLDIINYVSENNLDVDSVSLFDKEFFLANALIGNSDNKDIINFVESLTFENADN